jgi:hypothetical protein
MNGLGLTKDKGRTRGNMPKANHYPEWSDANAMLHAADETFSSNMQFESMLQRQSINVLPLI